MLDPKTRHRRNPVHRKLDKRTAQPTHKTREVVMLPGVVETGWAKPVQENWHFGDVVRVVLPRIGACFAFRPRCDGKGILTYHGPFRRPTKDQADRQHAVPWVCKRCDVIYATEYGFSVAPIVKRVIDDRTYPKRMKHV